MKLDTGSLLFNLNIATEGGTPSWGTSLGQSDLDDYKFKDKCYDILIGMVYKKVDSEFLFCPLGKGGNRQSDFSKELSAVFDKVYVNGEIIENAKFGLLIVKELTGNHHIGRRTLKYNPKISFNNENINENCFSLIRKHFNLTINSAWFIYDLSVKNQDELHFGATFCDKNNPLYFDNLQKRKEYINSINDEEIKNNDFTNIYTYENNNISNDILANELKKYFSKKGWDGLRLFGAKFYKYLEDRKIIKVITELAGLNGTQDVEIVKGRDLVKYLIAEDIFNNIETNCTLDIKNDNDVLEHNVYCIHIKNKNNALDYNNEHICIGWHQLGDLTEFKENKEGLKELFCKTWPSDNKKSIGQNVGQIWRFINQAKIGDYVIFSDNDKFSIGQIIGDYEYITPNPNEQDEDYVNNRKVKWIRREIPKYILSNNFRKALSTSMSFFGLYDYKSAVNDLLCGKYKKDDKIDDLYEDNNSISYYSDIDNKGFDRNRIIFGAPGTGKSYTLMNDVNNFAPNTFERVTFHPDYTYANFVGTYKPVPDKNDPNKITYEYVPGPFMRTLVKALRAINDSSISDEESKKPYVLVIEEINRANVASVFGDIFQLLDRDENGESKYKINPSEDVKKYLYSELDGQIEDYDTIKIPNNMFIWATMNSADQGVFPMDTAFKRRWNFEYIGIDNNESQNDFEITIVDNKYKWNKIRKAINNFLASKRINEDKLIGPFFIEKKILQDADKFVKTFKDKVIMYLFEDAARQIRNELFVKNTQDAALLYSKICEDFDKNGIAIFNKIIQEEINSNG